MKIYKSEQICFIYIFFLLKDADLSVKMTYDIFCIKLSISSFIFPY